MSTVPLVRRRDERIIAGVCTGLAAHLKVPVTWVRVGMAILTVLGGAGALLYLWLWVTVPWESPDEAPLFRRALMRPANQQDRADAPPASQPPGSLPRDAGKAQTSITSSSSLTAVAAFTSADRPDASNVGDASDSRSAPELVTSAEEAIAGEGATSPDITDLPDALSAPNTVDFTTVGNEIRSDTEDPEHRIAVADPTIMSATSSATTPAPEASSRRNTMTRWPIAELLLGGGLLISGIAFVLVQFGVPLHLEVVLPAIAVLAGVGLAWWQIADRDRPESNPVPRVLGALLLVAAGVLMFFVTAREPNTFTVIAAAFAVLAGVALAAAPWLLRLNRELIAERAGREREAERAEIAAHLHDSVLQTLAAIQQRSEPGSDVSRLARGQERELREWLFRAADGVPGPELQSLVVELRAHAVQLEAAHAVRFEIVAVGTDEQVAPVALLGSAKEAMLNAARHAGGDVTVYIEASPEQISVDVTDRGPGFAIDSLPDGRMGVRDSILGRMQRAGGIVKIVAGPGGTGSSVRLSLPRDMNGEVQTPHHHEGAS